MSLFITKENPLYQYIISKFPLERCLDDGQDWCRSDQELKEFILPLWLALRPLYLYANSHSLEPDWEAVEAFLFQYERMDDLLTFIDERDRSLTASLTARWRKIRKVWAGASYDQGWVNDVVRRYGG